MPRIARLISATGIYHVLSRGHNRRAIFLDTHDYQCYLDELTRFKETFPCQCYHFCLMPNHVHLLVKTERLELLTAIMRRVQQTYQFHWRRRYGLVGHLWQGRFKSIPIEKEAYLLECGRYIDRNPVRAGLCKIPEEYPWSSARTYLTEQQRKWAFLDRNPAYQGLAETEEVRRKEYRQYLEQTRGYEQFVDAQWARLT